MVEAVAVLSIVLGVSVSLVEDRHGGGVEILVKWRESPPEGTRNAAQYHISYGGGADWTCTSNLFLIDAPLLHVPSVRQESSAESTSRQSYCSLVGVQRALL